MTEVDKKIIKDLEKLVESIKADNKLREAFDKDPVKCLMDNGIDTENLPTELLEEMAGGFGFHSFTHAVGSGLKSFGHSFDHTDGAGRSEASGEAANSGTAI